jgi:hypothetical protein
MSVLNQVYGMICMAGSVILALIYLKVGGWSGGWVAAGGAVAGCNGSRCVNSFGCDQMIKHSLPAPVNPTLPPCMCVCSQWMSAAITMTSELVDSVQSSRAQVAGQGKKGAALAAGMVSALPAGAVGSWAATSC